MDDKKTHVASTIIGLAIALVFLFLAFRETDLTSIWSHIRQVNPLYTVGLFVISMLAVQVRALRWWLLLPRPLEPGDLRHVTRAIFVGYGVMNIASRLGEIVRILVLRTDSKRDLGSLASTVVADRMLFDFPAFAALFAYAVYGFRDQITDLFPQMEPAFQIFLLVTVVGVGGLFFFALRPEFFVGVLRKCGLPRFPVIWNRVEALLERLAVGLAVCAEPRRLLALQGLNLLTWLISIIYFHVAMLACGISLGLSEVILMFTISSLGVIVPSPGGLGSFHYFVSVALVQFFGVAETEAAAAATYAHGVNYFGILVAALIAFVWKPKGE